MVTRALQQTLGGDPKATAPHQQGRVPGSKNCKPALQPPQTVAILHLDPAACLAEDVFLDITPEPRLRLLDGSVHVGPPPAPRGCLTAAEEAARMLRRAHATDTSGSGRDWASAMSFFEGNPEASIPSAIAAIPWVARRANMKYYQTSTCEKARRVALSRLQAAPIQNTSPPRRTPQREPPAEPLSPVTPRRMARSVDMLRKLGDPHQLLASPRKMVDAIVGLSEVVAALVKKIQSDERPPALDGEEPSEGEAPRPQPVTAGGEGNAGAPLCPQGPPNCEEAATDGAVAERAECPEKERTDGSPRPPPGATEDSRLPGGRTGSWGWFWRPGWRCRPPTKDVCRVRRSKIPRSLFRQAMVDACAERIQVQHLHGDCGGTRP